MEANNNPDAGMEYNNKRQHEIADSKNYVSTEEIITLSDKTPRESGEIPNGIEYRGD